MNRQCEIALHGPHAVVCRGARRHRASASNSSRPRPTTMAETLWRSIETLAPLTPRFVSVTYGAGGSTRERTHATVARIVRETEPDARRAPDLRRRDPRGDRRDRAQLLGRGRAPYRRASRGDPPEPGQPYAPHPDGYANAAELVAGLKQVAPFEISVAAYPEVSSRRGLSATATSTISCARSTPGPTARSPNSSSRRTVSSASATGSRRPGSTSRSCRDPAGDQRRADAQVSPACAAPRSRTGWTGCSKGSTSFRRRASWSRRRSRRTVRPALCRRGAPFPLLHAQPRRAGLCHLPSARSRAAHERCVRTFARRPRSVS